MALFIGTVAPPFDNFQGTADADTFRFTPATLEAGDTVAGGGGGGLDILQFIAGGSFATMQFAGVSGIERIQHHAGGNSYALPANLAASTEGRLDIRGSTGADSVDGAAIVNAALGLDFFAGGGADTMIGGAGGDSFAVTSAFAGARHFGGGGGNDTLTVAIANWSGSDVFAGGAGTDRLVLTGAGTLGAAQLAGISGVEEIQLGANVAVTLVIPDSVANLASGTVTVLGGNGGAQLVDASAVDDGLVYRAGTGADTFLGGVGNDRYETADAGAEGSLGAGDDTLVLTSRNASGLFVNGGSGQDEIVLNGGGAWDLSGLVFFEDLELTAASALTLSGTGGLRVLGSSGRDSVTLGAANQTFIGFAGDDTVTLNATSFAGAVLNGGSQTTADLLRLTGPGFYDFNRAAITGFERIETAGGIALTSNIILAHRPVELLLRHAANVTMGLHADQTLVGSNRADQIALGVAGQFVDGGGGADTISGSALGLGAGTIVSGGRGNDTLVVTTATGTTVNLLTSGVVLNSIERVVAAAPLNLTLDFAPGREVQMSDGADTLSGFGSATTGSLGGGNDVALVGTALLDADPGTFSGGSGADTLTALDDFATAPLLISARFQDFEVIDLHFLSVREVAFEMPGALDVMLGGGGMTVTGNDENDTIRGIAGNASILGGEGNDLLIATAAPTAGQVIDGGDGDDEIRLVLGSGGSVQMPFGWAAERVQLSGAGITFFAIPGMTTAGLEVVADSVGGSQIQLGFSGQSATGGAGADTLGGFGAISGLTLEGGAGEDDYTLTTQLDFATSAWTISDSVSTEINEIRVFGSGTLAIDFNSHVVAGIDRIAVASSSVALDLTLSDGMALGADANADGTTGDIEVNASLGFSPAAWIDASLLAGARRLSFVGSSNGDTALGGAGADTLRGNAGADSLLGNAGADSVSGGNDADTLLGGLGADTLIGGTGNDLLTGGTGGDVIDLVDGGNDSLRYASSLDGTADINDIGGVPLSDADLITGFNAANDRLLLSVSGLGVAAGGAATVAASNGTWDIDDATIFYFASDGTDPNTLAGGGFNSVTQVVSAVNTDAGAGGGSAGARSVILAISNLETLSTRQTGIYLWNDDGDADVEIADGLRLLAILDGVTANQLATNAALVLIA